MTLIERLQKLTETWCAATGKSAATLSSKVVNDGKFFARIDSSRTCSVASWERFLAYFREPANWPDVFIPADAAALLAELDPIATPGPAIAVCGRCDLRAEDPAAACCTAPDCGLRQKAAA